MDSKNKICKHCGKPYYHENPNFCPECGGKLRNVCNCWIKKVPYNCGLSECPGYRIYNIERKEGEKNGSNK